MRLHKDNPRAGIYDPKEELGPPPPGCPETPKKFCIWPLPMNPRLPTLRIPVSAGLHFKPVKCPRCKLAMKKRVSKYGMFYGCARYPKCKGTRQL